MLNLKELAIWSGRRVFYEEGTARVKGKIWERI